MDEEEEEAAFIGFIYSLHIYYALIIQNSAIRTCKAYGGGGEVTIVP